MGMSNGLTSGRAVIVNSPGHRMDGKAGILTYAPGILGTFGVYFGEDGTYGFLRGELSLVADRLEELRAEIDAERISTGELIELASLSEYIDGGDVQLLEWAGVPEFPEDECVCSAQDEAGCASHAGFPCSHGQ